MIRPVKTKNDHKKALARINELMDIPKKSLMEKDELDILSTLVWVYEGQNFKIEPADPIEAMKFRMDQMGISQEEIEKLGKFKGYYYDYERDEYRVQFSVKGKKYRLGRYKTEKEAHAMYLTEKAKIKRIEKQNENTK